MKTLFGKEGYLFLINDSNKELEQHCNNIHFINDLSLTKYNSINNFLLIVYPDKSIILSKYLPDEYNSIYRPALNIYKNYLKDKLLDTYEFLKNEDDVYYKTDTHINLKGNNIVLNKFIEKINNLYNFNIQPVNMNLNKIIESAKGDLITIEKNINNMNISNLNLTDNYYYDYNHNFKFSNHYKICNKSNIRFLNKQLTDKTLELENENTIVDWNIISKYIIHIINDNIENKKTVIIFHDSFLVNIMTYMFHMFYNVYFIKNSLDMELIKKINYDFIFEFRVERFLN